MQARLNSIDQDIFQISPTWRHQSTATKGKGETGAVQACCKTAVHFLIAIPVMQGVFTEGTHGRIFTFECKARTLIYEPEGSTLSFFPGTCMCSACIARRCRKECQDLNSTFNVNL